MKLSIVFCLLLLSNVSLASPAVVFLQPPPSVIELASADKYFRTELYFGRSRPDGTLISIEEWEAFLNDVVTPRFPDGFTVLDGIGQYKDRSGRVIKEPSKVLIFLYTKKGSNLARKKIDEIRETYRSAFKQESVLRVDVTGKITVSF
jgi:hypothetical protein